MFNEINLMLLLCFGHSSRATNGMHFIGFRVSIDLQWLRGLVVRRSCGGEEFREYLLISGWEVINIDMRCMNNCCVHLKENVTTITFLIGDHIMLQLLFM